MTWCELLYTVASPPWSLEKEGESFAIAQCDNMIVRSSDQMPSCYPLWVDVQSLRQALVAGPVQQGQQQHGAVGYGHLSDLRALPDQRVLPGVPVQHDRPGRRANQYSVAPGTILAPPSVMYLSTSEILNSLHTSC